MKRKRNQAGVVMAIVGLLLTAPSSLMAQDSSPAVDYLIGPGDIVNISVWKDEALTRQCVVLPDGKIAFPLIGQIPAAGRTLIVIAD